MTYTTSQAPLPRGYLRTMLPLPEDVWHRIGSHLVKKERQEVLRASPELKKRYPNLWHTDHIYNALLPRSLQEQGRLRRPLVEPLTEAERQAAQRRQQAWLETYSRLRRWVVALPPQMPDLSPGKMMARVRKTGWHDIETMVALPDRQEVVLMGRRPNARSHRNNPYRKAYIYSLEDTASPWQGRLVPMPQEWCKPVRVLASERCGLFASFVKLVDMENTIISSLWQSDGESVEEIEWLAGACFDESIVCFRQDAWGIQCVVYGRKLREVGSTGIYWYSLQNFPNQGYRLSLNLDFKRDLSECGLTFVTMGLSTNGHSVFLVTQNGDIIISPMPGRGRVETYIRAQSLGFEDAFKDAVTSPGTNVLIMRDQADGLLAWKKHHASGRIIWRLPKPSTRSSTPDQQQITSYRLSPDGTRVGVLRGHTLLEIWSLAASHKPVSRFSLNQAPIVHFDFSPYSHALLVATRARTFVVLPTMPKPLKIPVPHIGETARFMKGMLRIVGHADGDLWDINLGEAPEQKEGDDD